MIAALIVAIVGLALAAILRSGLISALETPRADALKAAAEGTSGAHLIARLLENRDVLHPAINAVQSLLLLGAAVSATWMVVSSTSGSNVVLGMLGVVAFCWLFGDFLARAFGRSHPGRLAYRLAPLLFIVVRWGRAANELIAESDSEVASGDSDVHSEEEEEERELIDSVLEFTDTIVREVMVPRQDMVTIEAGAGLAKLTALNAEYSFSRIPVTDGVDSDVVGVVLTKDVLSSHAAGETIDDLRRFARDVTFIPETKRASDLLREMQASKTHLAMVVDEHGDVVGLVSIEDLLEELVGEIGDEHDPEEEMLEQLPDGGVLVDARLDVAHLGEAFSVSLPDDDWDTVGGLVLGLAGRVPEQGEKFLVQGLELEVVRLQGRRVAEVAVRPAQPMTYSKRAP
ncbi:MAG: hemolysin family protein [Actinomycetota bacterium]